MSTIKVVKAMDWPGAEEIAERIKKTIPAELTREDDGEKQDLPPEVIQQIEQASQYIQMLQQENQMLKAEATQKAEDRRLEKYKIDVDATKTLLVEEMKAQMQPLQDLGGRIQQIEAALGQLADVLVPAPAMGTGQLQGPMQ
jgi:phenylalanyl-tRNA synthetase alpha subunit